MINIKDNELIDFFEIFEKDALEDPNLSIYILADAAKNSKFLKAFIHLRQKCLLIEAAGDKARAVSPHLLQMPTDFSAKEWQWIQRYVAGTSDMSIIVSGLSFNLLFNYLRSFLEVQLEGGLDLFLAFWDPNILATLLGNKEDPTLYIQGPVFSEQQVHNFLTPIHSWLYWGRNKKLQKMVGLNQYIENLPVISSPLLFTEEQEKYMIEATLPDNLIYYLKLNNGFLVDSLNDQELYSIVVENLPIARNLGLDGTRDLINFMCLKLTYKDYFDTDSQLQNILSDVGMAKISMDDAMQKLMNIK